MAEVHIKDGETLESALRRFKRKVLQEDIIKEVKRHAFYLKPGQKKRVKSALAQAQPQKAQPGQRTGASPVSVRPSQSWVHIHNRIDTHGSDQNEPFRKSINGQPGIEPHGSAQRLNV